MPPVSKLTPLPPLPPSGLFIDLLRVLIEEGVCPDGTRRHRSRHDIARAVGISSKQLGNLVAGRSGLPQRETFEGILKAFFGTNPSHGTDWRVAMAEAWRAERGAVKEHKREHREDAVEQAPAPDPGSTYSRIRRLPLHYVEGNDITPDIGRMISVAPFRVVLYGPRGVGKTVCADAFASRDQKSYDTIAWVEAESAESCQSSLITLGQRLKCLSRDTQDGAAIDEVLLHLSDKGPRCLLIYDNAKDLQSLFRYLPNGNCHILITSTNPNWSMAAAPIEVSGWSPDRGAAYLAKALGHVDRNEAQELTRQLDGNALALSLAAAYCERRSLTLGQFRQRMAEPGPINPLLQSRQTAPGYAASIGTALSQSIQSAQSEHPLALATLRLLSVLSPTPMPLWLLSQLRDCVANDPTSPYSGKDIEDAVSVLRAHSLISVSQHMGRWLLPDTICTHALVSNYLTAQKAFDEDDVALADGVLLSWINSQPAETRATLCQETEWIRANLMHLTSSAARYANPRPENAARFEELREASIAMLVPILVDALQMISLQRMPYARRE